MSDTTNAGQPVNVPTDRWPLDTSVEFNKQTLMGNHGVTPKKMRLTSTRKERLKGYPFDLTTLSVQLIKQRRPMQLILRR